MIRRNNRTNRLIMWLIIIGDFVLLNLVLLGIFKEYDAIEKWSWENKRLFMALSNIALLISEWHFHPRIQQRIVSAGDILKRLTSLTLTQAVLAYLLMRHVMYWTGTGWKVFLAGTLLFCVLVMARLIERIILKRLRTMGRNTRTVTFVGSDSEQERIARQLINDPTTGYRLKGYYGDELKGVKTPWLGTVKSLMDDIAQGKEVEFGDEVYVCLSRMERDTIRQISRLCDKQMTQFYYVPISVESINLNLKREYVNDIEVFTIHTSPLEDPVNQAIKRAFDIVVSCAALLAVALLLPFVYLFIKLQSPGPLLFRQLRTGIDGKEFLCYKFRSMHVNKDSDKLQATKDDPRKFPFGNFMRMTNIDELPQFWNVLKGDMSIVGPRPHMLAHTEMYSKLIDQYMVRHFVKPGITGWAQVTGYRGETKELLQMEGRVRRDVWYIENWSIWLDIRIVWITFKSLFIPDKHAY